jgi:uncharacterized RDD family membrane protein YckC
VSTRSEIIAERADEISAYVASPKQRVAAAVIDFVLIGAAFWVGLNTPGWIGLPLVAVVLIGDELFAVTRWGQTFGKWCLDIRIVRLRDGKPAGWYGAWMRLLALTLLSGIGPAFRYGHSGLLFVVNPWIPICFAALLFDPQLRRGLHDRFAGTVVVDVRKLPSVASGSATTAR